MHGTGVVCMAGGRALWGVACVAGGHAWQGGVHGGGACHTCPPPANTTRYGDTVNERAVRILLECILVSFNFRLLCVTVTVSTIWDKEYSNISFLSIQKKN